MMQAIEAAAVLADEAARPRKTRATDHRLKVSFKVLPDEEALRRLPHYVADHELDPSPDPEDGTCYAPYQTDSGVGVFGELLALRYRSFRAGDLVKMEIRAEGQPARIRCLGLVSWVRINHDAALFRAGIAFIGVDLRDLT